MANSVAASAFSRAQLDALAQGQGVSGNSWLTVVLSVDPPYRVLYNPGNAAVEVDVRLPDTITGLPDWQPAVTYTAV